MATATDMATVMGKISTRLHNMGMVHKRGLNTTESKGLSL